MVDLDSTKNAIKKLVEKYNTLEKEGKLKDYNEEMTKKDFILPLFKSLGWDTENSKEVSAEEAIKNKRVDYGFKIEGIPKFFLEAKSLKDDDIINLKYVQQAIDYAWMKSCRWAVLTNFRTLVIYNAEEQNKDPRLNRFLIFSSPEDYLKDNRICLISKESFEKGELDKQAVEVGKAELKKPVDKALLDDITNFRELLYNSIKKNNTSKGLNEEDIEEAVQRIIDRMIFIRSAEDRGLEPEELRSKIREWSNTNKGKLLEKLSDLYKEYDDNYNSKLFAHHLCDDLKIDDDVLNTVINGLYESKDGLYRYDFSLLSADILGNIYEQYLGRILKKIGKNSKLEASKTKRKSEGIYYTPTYIVDSIVKNTVGEYIRTHKEKDIDNIKILDPACGSGSFLLKAYDTLENYWKEKNKLDETKLEESGSYSKKVDIVTKNIFGVDLDEKAVEIAQLNLLLKIAEKRKRLPKLQDNIKNGNSLIDDEKVSDKAFNWNEEFADIMKGGGFDVVVGNPPYINLANIKERTVREYFRKNYTTSDNKSDLYAFFTEQIATNLLKNDGYFGFIVSSTWTNLKSFINMRKILLNNFIILSLMPLPNGTFTEANVEPLIFIVKKEIDRLKIRKNKINILSYSNNHFEKIKEIPQKIFMDDKNNIFNFNWTPQMNRIFDKFKKNTIPLGEFIEFVRGTKTSDNNKFILKEKIDSYCKPVLRGRDIKRYSIIAPHLFIWYVPEEIKKKVGSVTQNPKLYEVDKKIILQGRSGNKIIATIDYNKYYCIDTVYVSKIKELKGLNINYFLALLNSRLINYWYGLQFKTSTVSGYELDQIPIKIITPKIKILYDELIILVNKMLLLNKSLNIINNKITNETNKMHKELKKTNERIDYLVYKLYGITDDEKRIIEESLK